MINFTTGNEYQGSNITTLLEAGFDLDSEFATFKQAVKFYNLTGKELRGAKNCATLMKIVEKKVKDKLTGELKKKKVPSTFVVFERSHLEAIIKQNTH